MRSLFDHGQLLPDQADGVRPPRSLMGGAGSTVITPDDSDSNDDYRSRTHRRPAPERHHDLQLPDRLSGYDNRPDDYRQPRRGAEVMLASPLRPAGAPCEPPRVHPDRDGRRHLPHRTSGHVARPGLEGVWRSRCRGRGAGPAGSIGQPGRRVARSGHGRVPGQARRKDRTRRFGPGLSTVQVRQLAEPPRDHVRFALQAREPGEQSEVDHDQLLRGFKHQHLVRKEEETQATPKSSFRP